MDRMLEMMGEGGESWRVEWGERGQEKFLKMTLWPDIETRNEKKEEEKVLLTLQERKIVFQHLQERKHLTFIALKDSNWKKWGEGWAGANENKNRLEIAASTLSHYTHSHALSHVLFHSWTNKTKNTHKPTHKQFDKNKHPHADKHNQREWKKDQKRPQENSISKNA